MPTLPPWLGETQMTRKEARSRASASCMLRSFALRSTNGRPCQASRTVFSKVSKTIGCAALSSPRRQLNQTPCTPSKTRPS
eukprot:1770621-Pleurochrysis_carterae.AAC.1